MLIKEVLKSCVSMLLPMLCVSCSSRDALWGLPICLSCKTSISKHVPPPVLSSKSLRKILSCRSYEGAMRECIKSFKYGGNMNLLKVFEEMIASFIQDSSFFPEKIDLVVPVPMYPGRRLTRGYNQSEIIARLVCTNTHLSAPPGILIKTRDTRPQMRLSRMERIKNLENSFTITDRLRITGKSVLLVDDIITTGATMEICASSLLRAGARSVDGFTLARTL